GGDRTGGGPGIGLVTLDDNGAPSAFRHEITRAEMCGRYPERRRDQLEAYACGVGTGWDAWRWWDRARHRPIRWRRLCSAYFGAAGSGLQSGKDRSQCEADPHLWCDKGWSRGHSAKGKVVHSSKKQGDRSLYSQKSSSVKLDEAHR